MHTEPRGERAEDSRWAREPRPGSAISRRRFLAAGAALTARALITGGASAGHPAPPDRASADRSTLARVRGLPADLVVVTGDSPAANCLAAVAALGGFARFVRPGDRVVIKPNPLGVVAPEGAVCTHPEMIAAVVRGCLDAGAGEVAAVSFDSRRFFAGNGTSAAVERSGGRVEVLEHEEQFAALTLPRSRILRSERIARTVLAADVFINMPIAKSHGETLYTGAMKNLMGINWDRQRFHATNLSQCIAELAAGVRHSLILMDANHVLLTNGPLGPGEVAHGRQVIAGVDPVAVDAFASRRFWPHAGEIAHIRAAYELGAGEIDLARLEVREFHG